MILNDQKSLLMRKHQMTASQKTVFDSLMSYEGNQLLAFVTGPGGCGKSFLLHTLVLQYEFNCSIVEVLATSGNAALLVNGRTVHSFFKLDCNLETSIQYRDTNWESICCTNVIIIDEISMMTAEILEKLSQICNQTSTMTNEKQLFGGKTVILFGDLLQLPAVTNSTSQSRQIYESQLWSKFHPFFLNENCRQSQDITYASLLNRVRLGNHTTEDLELLQTRVCGSGHDLDHECQNMTSSNSMVICSKHVERMNLNDQLQNSLLPTSTLHHLHATDYDAGGELLNKTESHQLNSLKSVMPQTISVKEGAKVMITRNLNVQS
ncbi:PIF1 [Mytilus coruscus]|uniref:ATP-dependent DNA helicase n=1 Tax=Mytilus coruscus TaxID=42192 RepID=A0A6J8C6Y4_MYTCO|nr:PIF1 [Mytilus coruscus]